MTKPWIMTADIHARYHGEASEFIGDRPAALHDLDRMFGTLAEAARARSTGSLMILGDLLHDPRQNHSATLQALARGIDLVPGDEQAILAGNHDLWRDRETVLTALDGVRPFIEPRDLWIKMETGGFMLRIVPYHREQTVMRTNLEAPDWSFRNPRQEPIERPDLKRVCLTHVAIQGGARGDWDYGGDSSGIPLEVFSRYDATFTGHFHRRQLLLQPGTKVVERQFPRGAVLYLGSPWALNRRDLQEAHGFTVFYPDTFEIEFVPCPGPVFREVTSEAELISLMEQHDPADLNIRAVLASPHEQAKIEQHRSYLRQLQAFTVPQDRPGDDVKGEIARLVDQDEALLAAYADACGVLDPLKTRAIRTGTDILRRA